MPEKSEGEIKYWQIHDSFSLKHPWHAETDFLNFVLLADYCILD